MDAKIKADWLKALRAGTYQQTTGALKRNNPDGTVSHCCLGVLCDVVGAQWVQDEDGDWTAVYSNERGTDREGGVLPDTLAYELFGEERIPYPQDPQVKVFENDRSITQRLSALNDGGHTFDQIANLIEEQL